MRVSGGGGGGGCDEQGDGRLRHRNRLAPEAHDEMKSIRLQYGCHLAHPGRIKLLRNIRAHCTSDLWHISVLPFNLLRRILLLVCLRARRGQARPGLANN